MTPTSPVGVNPALKQDRMPVVQVTNGDSWTLDTDVKNPVTHLPASPDNTILEFVLTENRFVKEPIWTGEWFNGVLPDDNIEGLVHVKIPKSVTKELRRGVYAFSMRVTDALHDITSTELTGHFQMEYEPTSELHNIPYRPET